MGDVIISGGFNIYPREIEDALLGPPGVREAAIVGAPIRCAVKYRWRHLVAMRRLTTRP